MASVVGRKPFSLSSVAFTNTITRIVCLLVRAGRIGLASERRTGFSVADIVLQIFSMIEVQGANGRFQVRDRDGAMTEIGRVVDPPICTLLYANAAEGIRSLPLGYFQPWWRADFPAQIFSAHDEEPSPRSDVVVARGLLVDGVTATGFSARWWL